MTDDNPPRIIVAVNRKPARWEIVSPGALLAILAFINFLNYVDRTVLGGLVPFLTDPVSKDGLGLTKAQAGLLQSAFMIVHSIASIPLGVLADRYLRKRLIAIGVGVWSVATAMAGFARSFAQMFIARAAVGIGEATYAPAASALISDRFPESERARAMGVFQLGTILGGGVGVIVGGFVARNWGWRAAFFVVGLPGLVLSVVVLFLHERDPAPKVDKPSLSLRIPLGTPASVTALMYIVTAGIMTSFLTGALQIWGPAFLLRALYGDDKMRITEVLWRFGPIVLLAGTLGAMAGSSVADRLESRHPGRGRLLTVAFSVFLASPCLAIAFAAHKGWVIYSMLTIGAFFATFYIGPILAALHDVVPAELRATATGAYFFAIHALGDSFSAWLVGKIDDITHSLRYGLLASTGVFLLAGFAALAAIPGSVRVARLKAATDPE